MQRKETRLIKPEPKKILWMKSDDFRSPTLDGDVNFSVQSKLNSKLQIHKTVFSHIESLSERLKTLLGHLLKNQKDHQDMDAPIFLPVR